MSSRAARNVEIRARNAEVKARLRDFEAAVARARRLEVSFFDPFVESVYLRSTKGVEAPMGGAR